MELSNKLSILAESAKYDVSCSSSGSRRSNTPGGIGNAAAAGICHSWSDDGRCISLLKILLTNDCIYDCAYCVNRRPTICRAPP
jgi:predicted DNA-binding helix-hairpin-helix protein